MDMSTSQRALNATDLDPKDTFSILNDIEIQALYLSTSLDHLTENLCNLLHSVSDSWGVYKGNTFLIAHPLQISSITSDNVDVFRNTVNNLSDTMDGNIRILYTIMAKSEEINKKFQEAEDIHQKMWVAGRGMNEQDSGRSL